MASLMTSDDLPDDLGWPSSTGHALLGGMAPLMTSDDLPDDL